MSICPEEPLAIASVSALALAGPYSTRALRKNLLLAAASVVLFLMILSGIEAGLRVAGVAGPDDALSGHAYSEIYGWAPRPGSRLVDRGGVTTINDAGYRGAALPAANDGKRRVVLLGDSIAFGLYVDDSETFGEVLQARYSGVEVANLAVQGYGPEQELAKLEHEGLRLRPDVVVVATCLSNDLADAVLPVFLYDGFHPKLYYRIEGEALVKHDAHLQLTVRERLALFLRSHSRLFGLLSRPPDPDAEDAHEPGGWGKRKRDALQDRAAAIELTARLLAAMAERSRAAGAQFVVLAFPDRREFEGVTHLRRALVRSPSVRSVPIVDMAERFRHAGLGFDDFAVDGIGHLSPEGHRETARILGQVLRLAGASL